MPKKDHDVARVSIVLAIGYAGLLFMLDTWVSLETSTGRLIGVVAITLVMAAAWVLVAQGWKRLQSLWSAQEGDPAWTRAGLAVVLLAGCGLFFELALIRWHASLFPMFAFYKNFSLLACFAGLGLGYATAGSRRISLLQCLVLLAFQIALLMLVRYGTGDTLKFLMTSPVAEQTTMGAAILGDHGGPLVTTVTFLVVYGLLASVFLTTVALFIPLGRLTGQAMETLPNLRAYGFNLFGSIIGVLAFMAVSEFWLPPVIWFALVVAVLLAYADLKGALRLVAGFSLGILFAALAWPVEPTHNRIFSPYQSIDMAANPSNGLMQILAAGTYYQKVFDFSQGSAARTDPGKI